MPHPIAPVMRRFWWLATQPAALVVQHTAIDAQAQSILDALGIRMTNRVVRVARPAAADTYAWLTRIRM